MKFFYIRITKCAGQTLHNVFSRGGISDFYIDPTKNKYKSFPRSPIDKALELTPNEFRLPPNTLSVSFVRNPFDRAVSGYFYFKLHPQLFGYFADPQLSFLSFLHLTKDLLNQGLPSKQIFAYRHLLPQSNFLLHEGAPFIDFIGRVERLDLHLSEFSKSLGNIGLEKAPKINRSSRREGDMQELYSNSECVNLIKEIYSEDLRRFNYSLGKNPKLPIIDRNY